MERTRERLEVARAALGTLQSLPLSSDVDDVVRDAAIQRFEYTFEASWKAAQQYLRDLEGLAIASPKGVIRASFQSGLLPEEAARDAMNMADDRNLTSHTYNETLAQEIFSRLAKHALILDRWLEGMEHRANRDLA